MLVHRRQIPVFGQDGYCGLQRSFAAMELRPALGAWWLRLLPIQDRPAVLVLDGDELFGGLLAPELFLACACVRLCNFSSV